jgi:plastocyanin
MHRARKFAGLGTLAIFTTTTTGSLVIACVGDGTSGACQCASHFTLSPSPAAATTGLSLQGVTRGLPPGGGPDATQLVHVFNFDYSTNDIGMPIMDATIHVGDTIHWTWDSGVHSVTTVGGSIESFDSGDLLAPTGTYDHTFTHAGLITYYCDLHGFDNMDGTASGMAGTITVEAPSSSWNVDFDGSWQTATNWNNNIVPNAPGYVANFGPVISGPRGVNLNGAVTVGTVNFDSPSFKSYLIAGGPTLTMQSADTSSPAAVNVLSGSHTITAPLATASDTTFNVADAGGTLRTTNLQATSATLSKAGAGNWVVNNVRAAALNINGGTVSLQANGGNTGTSRVGTLAVAGGSLRAPSATLDLNDNDLILTATPAATVQALIVSARNAGAWNQMGITSSAARNQTSHATTLGLLSGAEYHSVAGGGATFSGFGVNDSDVLVKYTWYGDTDFNGKVNFDDYVRTDNGFNNHLSGWLNGDFDLNGQVNFDDYVLIDLAFNTQSGTLGRALRLLDGSDTNLFGPRTDPALRLLQQHLDEFGSDFANHFLAAVPEPGALCLLALATPMALRRRAVHS